MSKDSNRELLFSITAKDFEIQTFAAGGKGGQNQNTSNTGVRLIHRDSGARAESRDSRSQEQNKKSAFRKLIASPEFQRWYRVRVWEEINKKDLEKEIQRQVERDMCPENVLVEVRGNDGWISYVESDHERL